MNRVASAVVAHGHSVSVGLCQGYSAVLLPQLSSPDSDFGVISAEAASWLAALGVISNPLGALIGGTLAEVLGRKITLLISALPYVLGWLLIAAANDLYWLGIGRFVTGFAVGLGSVSYVYVAEVSRPEQRGTLAATGPVLVSLGVLLAYSLGAFLPWRVVALVAALVAVCTGLMAVMLPESPPWLVSHGREDEAKEALNWLRNCPDKASAEVDAIKCKETADEKFSCTSFFRMALEPCVWKPFFILVAFFFFQEASGIYVILFYAVDFVREVGAGQDESLVSIGIGLARLVMSLVGAFLLCKFPRKTLAAASALLMTLAMGATTAYEFLFSSFHFQDRILSWIPAFGVLMHVCVSMLGMLQLPWIMTSELFPLRVRSVAVGLVTALAHLLIFASVKTYPGLLFSFGLPTTLGMFTTASLFGAVFAICVLPETKDKTLGEIESEFSDKNKSDFDRRFEICTVQDCSVKLRNFQLNNV
ncbi:facilitated trehalose transporter Tret1-like isoform X2 [Neocloeon triangulifer]|uniref:facilitated trehalose transporter Tret1-like isoform X2 n=1 Tax=Neocloeon triangulifer TaxID=2078957 RepID=UPI00286F9182|nr:facilitated trehalose transporter Tret1-like isoform X2 [Neocloeon triangulifer]